MFEIEEIPNEDFLFMRVHKTNIDEDGEPHPRAFKNQPTDNHGMSVDWSKYAQAIDTKNRAKKPAENAVIKFTAGSARAIPNQTIIHEPIEHPEPNQAHTEVFGSKKIPTEVRARFMDIYEIAIPLEA